MASVASAASAASDIPLSQINCNGKSANNTKSKSKVYNEPCYYKDYLLDISKSKKKQQKNNSIRRVKEMMAQKELSDGQKELLEDIAYSLSSNSKTSLAAVNNKTSLAAVLFDMKALGDITQFEYFIENLDLFESFETHDTILLLLAIICIGEKYKLLQQKYNDKTASTFLYFATKFTKSNETVPYYYKLSIDDLNTIYVKICKLLDQVPGLSGTNSETILLLLKVFARILDSCHDFLKEQREAEEDEDDGELLIIEHYLNSIFNPAN